MKKPTAKILIVEDESIVAQDLQAILEDLGYEVPVFVDCGELAIEKTAEIRPDLILMDIRLIGEMDGIEAAQKIKEKFDIPIVYLTAHGDEDTLSRAKITQPFGYLIKPFNEQELRIIIEISLYRHQLDQKIKENAQWLSTILNSIGDGVIVTDTKGDIIFINPAAEKLTGWSLVEALNQPITSVFNLVDETTQKSLNPFLIQVIKSGEITQLPDQTSLITKNGSLLPISDSISPIGTASHINFVKNLLGELSGTVFVFQDNTQRKLAQEQLRQQAVIESEQKLQSILEHAPAAIYLFDLENKYIFVNSRCTELLSTTPDQVIGKSIYDVWDPETADIFVVNNRQVVASQQVLQMEETINQPDGIHTYISLKFPLYDINGKIYAVCGISTDITERKEAERKIAEQASLIDLASDAIIVTDLDQNILFWNQGAERLYDWKAEEVIGKSRYEFLSKNTNIVNEVINTTLAKGSWRGELEQITKTGKEIIVASRWNLLDNGFNKPHSILIFSSDITEKKQLEKEFYQAQRLESLGTLASGIAHDLNNVFTPISCIVQLLKLGGKNLDDKKEEFLDILENSVERGAGLVQQILVFARGSDGSKAVLQIGPLLKEIAKIAQQTIPKFIKVQRDIDNDLFLIRMDPTEFHQILMNLIINARDAMPNGGTITISAHNQFIDLIYAGMNLKSIIGNYHQGNYVVISVTDTGVGIPSDILDRMFEPFFTTKEVGKGTGLGLATVLGIVKNSGGFLQVLTEVGKGTQFKVYLPAVNEKIKKETSPKDLSKGNGELILIVDDEPFIREITKISLEDNNYQTMIANDGVEAIALYVKHSQEISIILMDIIMPSINGLNAICTLKTINPNVKIIANSGLSEHRQSALEVGASAFLLKPYSIEDLLLTIDKFTIKKKGVGSRNEGEDFR
jgi:PAS domain S-box-containing protein